MEYKMSQDRFSHLNALQFRLHNEEQRLEASKTPYELQCRQVWVDGIKKEIVAERKFLGLPEVEEDVSIEELDAFVNEMMGL